MCGISLFFNINLTLEGGIVNQILLADTIGSFPFLISK